MYKIIYRKSALKSLSKMPRKIADKFTDAFMELARGQGADLDIKSLEGREGLRLRIGAYRAIYRQLNDVMIIDV